jgi:hypothetical protein
VETPWLGRRSLHDAEESSAVPIGVPAAAHRTRAEGPNARGAGAAVRAVAIRGILNATANHILTLMAQGIGYPAALTDAQAHGYAESDPTDDVEGHDVVAKRVSSAAQRSVDPQGSTKSSAAGLLTSRRTSSSKLIAGDVESSLWRR